MDRGEGPPLIGKTRWIALPGSVALQEDEMREDWINAVKGWMPRWQKTVYWRFPSAAAAFFFFPVFFGAEAQSKTTVKLLRTPATRALKRACLPADALQGLKHWFLHGTTVKQ